MVHRPSSIVRCSLLIAHCSFILAACAPQPLTVTREPATIRLAAADSFELLAGELAAAYEASHPWATILIETRNGSFAEQALRAGEADLAILSWPDDDAEEPLWSLPFARDGIAVVAHPSTPFTQTNTALLQVIFRGRVQEWNGVVLTVVSREEGSGTRAAFESMALDGHETTLTAIVVPSAAAVVETVARTPGAVGYVSTTWPDSPESQVLVLPVNGILPTGEAIADGSYPLWRTLYLSAVTEPEGEAHEFVEWVLGPDGQAITRR